MPFRVCFSLIWENRQAGVGRFGDISGLLPWGGTGLMAQSQPLPFSETRPFALPTSSQATLFSNPPLGHW